jgi:predicted carbohydrate-binding protein with CBM5 and CBM33 domain
VQRIPSQAAEAHGGMEAPSSRCCSICIFIIFYPSKLQINNFKISKVENQFCNKLQFDDTLSIFPKHSL